MNDFNNQVDEEVKIINPIAIQEIQEIQEDSNQNFLKLFNDNKNKAELFDTINKNIKLFHEIRYLLINKTNHNIEIQNIGGNIFAKADVIVRKYASKYIENKELFYSCTIITLFYGLFENGEIPHINEKKYVQP